MNLLYANEKVRPEYIEPTADVTETETADNYEIVPLLPLIRMQLNSFRDMLSVGILDEAWLPRLAPLHAERLQQLIDDPDG